MYTVPLKINSSEKGAIRPFTKSLLTMTGAFGVLAANWWVCVVFLQINSSEKGAIRPFTKSPTANAAEYWSAAACLKPSDILVIPVSSYIW